MAIFNTVYGGEPKWKPWANTLAYWKLNWSLNDEMWNYNLTNSWTSFYNDTSIWRQVLYCDGSSHYVYTTALPSSDTTKITLHIWNKWLDMFHNQRNMFDTYLHYPNNRWIRFESWSSDCYFVFWWQWSTKTVTPSVTSTELNNWGLWTVTFDRSTLSYNIYYNSSLKNTWTVDTWTYYSEWLSNFTLWLWFQVTNARSYYGYIWETVLENKIETIDEVTLFYNTTKANYWL